MASIQGGCFAGMEASGVLRQRRRRLAVGSASSRRCCRHSSASSRTKPVHTLAWQRAAAVAALLDRHARRRRLSASGSIATGTPWQSCRWHCYIHLLLCTTADQVSVQYYAAGARCVCCVFVSASTHSARPLLLSGKKSTHRMSAGDSLGQTMDGKAHIVGSAQQPLPVQLPAKSPDHGS